MNSSNMLHYISKAIERPLMIMPEKLALIAQILEGRIGIDASSLQHLVDEKLLAYVSKPSASRFEGDMETNEGDKLSGRRIKPYRTKNGTAIISIVGSLVNRGAWIGSSSGMTSYEGISHQLASAARDSSIKSILLDIDSPGGEAVGAFEVGALVRKIDGEKPVTAFVNGMCCSAAYAIGSGARRIEAGSTALVGSIGVVMMHTDQSARMHQMGVKPTFIFAGAHKVDGNPFEPLSQSVKSDMQAEVDKFYDLFVGHVAAGRKGLSAKAVRETEARTFIGSDAVERKLVDAIGTFETTLQGAGRSKTRTMKMDNHDPIYSAEQHSNLLNAAISQARTEAVASTTQALTAEHTTAIASAQTAARAEGATAERERISAILALPEAEGRQAAAMHMAMTTGMSADAVKPILAGLPIGAVKPAAPANGHGLVVEKPGSLAAAAAQAAASGSAWDKSLTRAGANLPGVK